MNETQVLEIKHMAFAVRDVETALGRYKRFLRSGEPDGAAVVSPRGGHEVPGSEENP